MKSICDCPAECEAVDYDYYILDNPTNSNLIELDVHFEGPTGVRYKREIVTSDLDMLGIIFLFLKHIFISDRLLFIMKFHSSIWWDLWIIHWWINIESYGNYILLYDDFTHINLSFYNEL